MMGTTVMEKDTEAKIEQAEVKLRKKIEATLWKAGYVTSKPLGLIGMCEGHEVIAWRGLVFIRQTVKLI
ncbi:MAG TPA: hypothetical protein VN207_01760 [Ktedonobacteraceae bacterium]|nr:hypothetical protein [Ktedonobacteraceae bacterium]